MPMVFPPTAVGAGSTRSWKSAAPPQMPCPGGTGSAPVPTSSGRHCLHRVCTRCHLSESRSFQARLPAGRRTTGAQGSIDPCTALYRAFRGRGRPPIPGPPSSPGRALGRSWRTVRTGPGQTAGVRFPDHTVAVYLSVLFIAGAKRAPGGWADRLVGGSSSRAEPDPGPVPEGQGSERWDRRQSVSRRWPARTIDVRPRPGGCARSRP